MKDTRDAKHIAVRNQEFILTPLSVQDTISFGERLAMTVAATMLDEPEVFYVGVARYCSDVENNTWIGERYEAHADEHGNYLYFKRSTEDVLCDRMFFDHEDLGVHMWRVASTRTLQ
jgi:hypothetical protein